MSIFKAQMKPNEVFNPRGEYNPEMYVSRPEYERDFELALESDLCILVHGQSGTGKTWLTRRMLAKEKLNYKVVNLATAANANSIYTCFQNIMSREKWEIRSRRTDTIATSVNAAVAKGELTSSKVFENNVDYFYEFLKFLKVKSMYPDKKRYIIFENMEAIIDKVDMVRELANLITLMDDDEVIKYKTKFVIIGATKDIHQYFRTIMNVNTIDNRLYELPDIGTLTMPQAKELVQRGFDKLEIEFENMSLKSQCINEYIRVTGGVPQRLHELCLIFAELARKTQKEIGEKQIKEGIRKWIHTSLNKNYAYISRLLDQDGNENSFKNKVLYCVAQKDSLYFTKDSIDKELIAEFPDAMNGKSTTSTKVLNELCKCKPPLLCKTEDVFGEYAFTDFKCALCLRAILLKDGEMVYKSDAYDIIIDN